METRNNKLYHIYHIPGLKIGVTQAPKVRVETMQGYKKGEYEILESHKDIDKVSYREIELQKEYGYKVDRQLYKNLKHLKRNSIMDKFNVTLMTTTFPVPLNKLKGRLHDLIDKSFMMNDTEVLITEEIFNWICKNASTSQYNRNRCYIYNKALEEYMKDLATGDEALVSKFDLIRDWAQERGLYDKGDTKTQYVKLMEEAGELAQGLLKDRELEVADAIGDMVVVLTNLAHLAGLTIEECIDSAYNEIKNRKGEMKGGTFVKETL